MEARTTLRSAYRCDTGLLIREVLEAREAMWARTARWPCVLRVHPLDGRALTMAEIGEFGPVISIRIDDMRPYFRDMAMLEDSRLPPGIARLEICDGCMRQFPTCEHG